MLKQIKEWTETGAKRRKRINPSSKSLRAPSSFMIRFPKIVSAGFHRCQRLLYQLLSFIPIHISHAFY